eukprot:1147087-Pelagomonas_calceolata.AAC.2
MLLTPSGRQQRQQRRQQQQQEQVPLPGSNLSLHGMQHFRSQAAPMVTITSACPKPSPASSLYHTLASSQTCPPPDSCSSKAQTAQASAASASCITHTRSQGQMSQVQIPSSVTSTATAVTAPSSFPPASAPASAASHQIIKPPLRKSWEAMDGQSGKLYMILPRTPSILEAKTGGMEEEEVQPTSLRSGNKISPCQMHDLKVFSFSLLVQTSVRSSNKISPRQGVVGGGWVKGYQFPKTPLQNFWAADEEFCVHDSVSVPCPQGYGQQTVWEGAANLAKLSD